MCIEGQTVDQAYWCGDKLATIREDTGPVPSSLRRILIITDTWKMASPPQPPNTHCFCLNINRSQSQFYLKGKALLKNWAGYEHAQTYHLIPTPSSIQYACLQPPQTNFSKRPLGKNDVKPSNSPPKITQYLLPHSSIGDKSGGLESPEPTASIGTIVDLQIIPN